MVLMKPFFKYPINVVLFILFLVSLLFPVVSFGGDFIAYFTGHHHGFSEPWPTIQNILNTSFVLLLIAFLVDVTIYGILKEKKNIT